MEVFDGLKPYAHWFLRLALGSVFIVHGIGKFPDLSLMGLPTWVVLLVGLGELGGGILVLLGGFGFDWMTRLGALIPIPIMLGAIFMVHWPKWTFPPSDTHPVGGMEFQVTLILIMLYLLVKGNRGLESAS